MNSVLDALWLSLAIVLSVLNVLDFITTRMALKSGNGVESNWLLLGLRRLLDPAREGVGPWAWLIVAKGLLAVAVWVAYAYMPPSVPALASGAVVALIYSWVVVSNHRIASR